MSGGIYHRTQIDLTYNSNHIEGSSIRLTHEQTRYIFETNTIITYMIMVEALTDPSTDKKASNPGGKEAFLRLPVKSAMTRGDTQSSRV